MPSRRIAFLACLLVSPLLAHSQTFVERDALTGTAPVQVVHADFNNDSIPDLAIANRDSHSVTVWIMNGDGTFRNRLDIGVGNYPVTGIAATDLNHDRKIDLVAINSDPELENGTLAVMLGNGDGTFQSPMFGSVGQEPTSLDVGDFNGDGNVDLVNSCLLGSKGLSSILFSFGDGKGNFPAIEGIANLGDNGYKTKVAAGDFNHDGKPDVAFLEDRESISDMWVMINLGNNNYSTKKVTDVSQPFDLAAADVNQDGFDDLLLTHHNCLVSTSCQESGSSVTYFKSKGDGTFTAQRAGTLSSQTARSDFFGPSAGDVNTDGLKDVIVTALLAGKTHSSVAVFNQQADGSFASAKNYDTNLPATDQTFGSTLAEDLNRDGRLDMVVTGTQNQVAALINTTPIRGCPAPSSFRTVKFCLPKYSTMSSPVQILANSRDNLPMEAMQIYVDGALKFFTNDDLLSTRLTMSNGDHRLTVKGWDRLGSFSQTINFTVAGGCVLPGIDRSVKICTPTNGATVSSPVHIQATLNDSGDVQAAQIYVDGVVKFSTGPTHLVETSLAMSPGTHRVTVKGWDAAGPFWQTINITVQ